MSRTLLTFAVLALLTPAVLADVIIRKGRGSKLTIIGMPKKIGTVEITPDNVELYLEQSTGVITVDGYTGVSIKKTAKTSKATVVPAAEVYKKFFTTEPDALLDGYDQMSVGAYARAVGAFRDAYRDEDARTVYRLEAYFQIGRCYILSGNLKNAIAHLGRWQGKDSAYSPEVHRILAELYTANKQYSRARTEYKKIGALPDISENWKYTARLGDVKVDIAERKFDVAEKAAATISSQIGTSAALGDAKALAHVLQAKAVLGADIKERLPHAETILNQATRLKNVSSTNSAFLYATLGDALYLQGKVEQARYPYMRVVLMYPGEASYVAHGLLNAGQCYVDLSGRLDGSQTEGDQAKSDDYLIKGMKLLGECAGRNRGTSTGRQAAKTYRQHKARYEALKAAAAGEPAPAGGADGSEEGK